MTSSPQDAELVVEDVKHEWLALIRRLQSVAMTGGVALISVYVLVDENGLPLLWLPPKCQRIEPNKQAREILRDMLERDGFGL